MQTSGRVGRGQAKLLTPPKEQRSSGRSLSSGGTVPEMLLLYSCRHVSCESLPVSEGMVPEMELLYR